MNALLWLLPGLPALTGGVLLLVRRAPRVVAISAAALTLALAVWAAVARPAVSARLVFRSGLAVDGLSAVMVVTVAAVALAVLVFAAGELREGRFFGLMLIFVAAMLVTVTATDLVLLLMGWEVMGAMSYALIGYWWRDGSRVRAGTISFVTTRAGDLGLYLAAGAALAGALAASGAQTGALAAGLGSAFGPETAAGGPLGAFTGTAGSAFAGVAGGGVVPGPGLDGVLALGGLPGLGGIYRDLVAGGIVLAALGKSAQVPFSFWLSRAMAGPSPVSALLHSATMVAAGAYLLLRVEPLLAATEWAATVVSWAGVVTALLLGAVALAQRDLKQLLAASTCAQLGFMVLGAGVGAVAGGTAQLVAHAAVKSLLFLGAGAWLTALGTKDLGSLGTAARRYPLVGVTFTVGALALAGVPPLSLWVTKDAILGSVSQPALYGVALVAALLSAAYAAKALVAVWRPASDAPPVLEHGPEPVTGRVGVLQGIPLPVLAVGAATLGVVGLPSVFDAWSRLVGDAGAPGPTGGELVLSGALAVAVVAAVVIVARRSWVPAQAGPMAGRTTEMAAGRTDEVTAGRAGEVAAGRAGEVAAGRGSGLGRAAGEWLYLERGAEAGLWRPMLALARGAAWFDDHVVDGIVRAVPRAGMAAARVARRPFEVGVDGVVQGLARTAGRLGRVARRPQTGQVHTYFAQAAVALIVLAVVFAVMR
ncbi:proton-conducting transporter transmembrane domain-containing protein [Nonomuraea sediminis]|uniref:proton-conducting transporter transmembrane domain-containing protein n=1 Tax=Nonomuraea sediminis TaxID=2835864 RepID=UPI001BDDC052|nr:proton-conducting transporter membrane subunit [Nonomuraea sediminis]